MNSDIKITKIQTIEEFDSFKDKWKEFEKAIGHPNLTSSFDWLNTWWHTFKDIDNEIIGYDKKLLIICLYEKDKLISGTKVLCK